MILLRIFRIAIPIIILSFCISCIKLKGEFSIKRFQEDYYKRINNNLEFNRKEKIDWVFKLDKNVTKVEIGVILLKKELVWVEIQSKKDYISSSKKAIYGKIYNFPEGEYQIVLTNILKERIIDKLFFTIYFDEEEY